MLFIASASMTVLAGVSVCVWTVLLSIIAVECAQAPPNSKRKLFFLEIPVLYYPLVLLALFSLFAGFRLAYCLGVAVGYLQGFGKLSTPFLTIVLHHKPLWSSSLLAFIWICALSGIGVEAFFPLWKFKNTFSLAMYLGMGWSCLVCMHDFVEILPANALYLIVAGGVAYTSGVPFFVRNNNLDHSIWHVFVIAGSFFHWLSVYLYVVEIETV